MFGVLINYDYLYSRKIKILNNSIVNKFNIYFLKKVADLFCGLIVFLYLRGVTRKIIEYYFIHHCILYGLSD